MRKMLFIYNPRAGRGAIRDSLSYILEEFSRHDMEITVHPTRKNGDAAEVVQTQGCLYDLIVCSGGDGTLDEVVTGMMRGKCVVPIGYIPAGSTNDYASSLGIPKQMKEAARDIANGRVYLCDVGKLSDRYFVYVAAFGAFTEVSYKTDQTMKNNLGHLAYLLEGAKSLSSIKAYHITYESEESTGEGDFILGMITNSNSVGGFKGITGNDVNLNDGRFEVTLIRMPENPFEYPPLINALLNGTSNEKLITFKTAHLVIRSGEEVPWTVDGEYGGSYTEAVVDNVARSLPLVLGHKPEDVDETDQALLEELESE